MLERKVYRKPPLIEMFADFSAKVGDQLKKLQAIEDADLVAINKLLTELQLPVVYVPLKKATTM